LLGKKAGENVTLDLTFPAEYGAKDLAGKNAQFAVQIHSVEQPPQRLKMPLIMLKMN